MKYWAALLACMLGSSADADAVLSTAMPRVSEGSPLTLQLTLLNPTDAEQQVELPPQLRLRVENNNAVTTTETTADRTGVIVVPPQGFVVVNLAGNLPTAMTGPLTLQLSGIAANALLLHVEPGSTAVPTSQQASVPLDVADKPPPLALSPYEPVYVLVGGDGGLNAKFQISFRYRLFDDRGKLAQRLPWLDDLYLGYSQTSLWDLGELSKPFRDSSYRPRLFYAKEDVTRFFDGLMHFNLEAGFGHESNGREGEESRSFNMFYARPTFLVGEPDGFRAFVSPLIHNYIAADENPDLSHYRGYVDWQFGVGSKGGLDFTGTVRKGTRSHYGSVELNLSYPLSKLSGGDLTGWLMLQYFGGWGESLLDYQRKLDSQFRLGIAVAL